jgi:hypothetical protein
MHQFMDSVDFSTSEGGTTVTLKRAMAVGAGRASE